MRRLAFHRLIRPNGAAGLYRVAEVDDDGCYCGDAALEGERAGVEWVGGVALLLPEGCRPRAGDSVAAVLAAVAGQRRSVDGAQLRLWLAVGFPAGADPTMPVRAYRLAAGIPRK